MERRTASRTPALKSSAMIEVPAGVVKGVVISEDSAVGYVGVVVVDDIVMMPIISPVVPAPAKTAEEADSKAETKRNTRSGKVQSGIPIPAGPDPDGLSIREPGIIFRNVNDLRVRGLDHNGLPLLSDVFL